MILFSVALPICVAGWGVLRAAEILAEGAEDSKQVLFYEGCLKSTSLPSPVPFGTPALPPQCFVSVKWSVFCACLGGHTLSVFPLIFSRPFFPALVRGQICLPSIVCHLVGNAEVGEAAGLRYVRAVMHVFSRLSKASETSDCGEDLRVSSRSDDELILPVVSPEKLLVPWVWAAHSQSVLCPRLALRLPSPALLRDDLTAWHRPAAPSGA